MAEQRLNASLYSLILFMEHSRVLDSMFRGGNAAETEPPYHTQLASYNLNLTFNFLVHRGLGIAPTHSHILSHWLGFLVSGTSIGMNRHSFFPIIQLYGSHAALPSEDFCSLEPQTDTYSKSNFLPPSSNNGFCHQVPGSPLQPMYPVDNEYTQIQGGFPEPWVLSWPIGNGRNKILPSIALCKDPCFGLVSKVHLS